MHINYPIDGSDFLRAISLHCMENILEKSEESSVQHMLPFNSICRKHTLPYHGMLIAQISGSASHECKAGALPRDVLFILSPNFPSTQIQRFSCIKFKLRADFKGRSGDKSF